MSLSLVIAGGGTGGHLYPGIAVARELLRRVPTATVTFVGTAAGIESRVVPRERWPAAGHRARCAANRSIRRGTCVPDATATCTERQRADPGRTDPG